MLRSPLNDVVLDLRSVNRLTGAKLADLSLQVAVVQLQLLDGRSWLSFSGCLVPAEQHLSAGSRLGVVCGTQCRR